MTKLSRVSIIQKWECMNFAFCLHGIPKNPRKWKESDRFPLTYTGTGKTEARIVRWSGASITEFDSLDLAGRLDLKVER